MKPQAEKNPVATTGGITITITIDSADNATLQGEIHWREGSRRQRFRSEIELLRQISDAVEASAPKERIA